jgi:hypothetical protein
LRSSYRHRLVFEVAFTRTLHQLEEQGLVRDSNCSLGDVASHLDERDPNEVLGLVELEHENWEAAEEDLQIARLESEPDSRIDLLRAVLDSAFDDLVQGIVDRALLPAARRYLNRFPHDAEANVLPRISRSGLHQQLPVEFQLQTTTAAEVRRIMNQQPTASIGIAGPRGSGKTTLIEWFTRDTSRGSSRHAGTGQRRVFVSAPVQYDPRDFLLHIFAEVCLSIIGNSRDRRPGAKDFDKPREIGAKTLRTVYGLVLRVLALALAMLAAYLGYLLYDKYFDFPIGPEVVQQVLALVGISWIGLNLSMLVTALHVEDHPFFGMLTRPKRPDRPLILLSLVALAGAGAIAYSAFQYQYVLDNYTLGLMAGLPIAVLTSTSVWRLLRWQQRNQPGVLEDWSIGSAVRRSKTELQTQAQAFLDQIHFQQTFTSGWGGKLTATSPVISGELSNSEGLSLSRLAWTLPETVKNLRRVLADAAKAADTGIVIGIDELDKIEDPVAARRFVDDIKAVFHVPGCFFLVSVSDDAVTSFETRGLPFRDAFDSAFDEVVRVDYGNLENSRDVLNGRLVGLPVAFVALCHVLAGGLPRDLLRVTRYLLSLDVSRSAQLSPLSVPLVQRELFAKIAPLLRRVVEVNASTIFSILSWAERAGGDWENLDEIHDRLREFSGMISLLAKDESITSQQRAATLRACSEAEVAYLLGCTVVEYCRSIDAPRIPIALSERLASLAVVRQKIAVHPVIAALQLQEFRRDEALPRLELWTDAAAVSPS